MAVANQSMRQRRAHKARAAEDEKFTRLHKKIPAIWVDDRDPTRRASVTSANRYDQDRIAAANRQQKALLSLDDGPQVLHAAHFLAIDGGDDVVRP